MTDHTLERNTGAVGPGRRVQHHSTVTLSDGDSYDTGLSSVDVAVGTATTSDTAVTVSGISGGSVTFNVQTAGSGASDEEIHVIAIGER